MSLGSSKTTKQNVKTVMTPTLSPMIGGAVADQARRIGQVSFNPAVYMTAATTNQQQGFARAAAGTGNPVTAGVNATNGLLGYQAQSVDPSLIKDANLKDYTNPYQQLVIDAYNQNAAYNNDVGLNALRSKIPMGAFNGPRSALTQEAYLADQQRSQGSDIANLLSGGYDRATSLAGQDAATRNAVATGNADRDLSGAGLRLNAAGQSANLGLLGAQNTRADTAQQLAAGETERGINQDNNSERIKQQLLANNGALLAQLFPALVGSDQTQDSKTKEQNKPGLLEIAGTVANIMGNISGFKLPGGGK